MQEGIDSAHAQNSVGLSCFAWIWIRPHQNCEQIGSTLLAYTQFVEQFLTLKISMMRKSIFAILLLISASAQAQTFKFTAFESSLLIGNDEPLTQKVDFLITVSVDRRKIRMYSNKEKNYDLVSLMKSWDEEGNEHNKYKAVDQDGKECILETAKYGNKVNFGVCYPGYCYIYKAELSK